MPEKVAVDLVKVHRAWAAVRKATHENIGPITIGAGLVIFEENVVPDDGAAWNGGQSRTFPVSLLILDLHAIPNGIMHQVVFNEAAHEGRAAIGIAKIQSGAAVADDVTPDDPVPSGCFCGDANGLLGSIPIADDAVFNEDMMNGVFESSFGTDTKQAGDTIGAFTQDREPFQGDITAIEQLDTVGCLGLADFGHALFRPLDGDPGLFAAMAISERQTPMINACLQDQGVPWNQSTQNLAVIFRPSLFDHPGGDPGGEKWKQIKEPFHQGYLNAVAGRFIDAMSVGRARGEGKMPWNEDPFSFCVAVLEKNETDISGNFSDRFNKICMNKISKC